MTTAFTHRQAAAVREFLADFPGSAIRDIRMADRLRTPQLRSKKHDHLAVAWDELGNAFVLTARLQRKQLIKGEI